MTPFPTLGRLNLFFKNGLRFNRVFFCFPWGNYRVIATVKESRLLENSNIHQEKKRLERDGKKRLNCYTIILKTRKLVSSQEGGWI